MSEIRTQHTILSRHVRNISDSQPRLSQYILNPKGLSQLVSSVLPGELSASVCLTSLQRAVTYPIMHASKGSLAFHGAVARRPTQRSRVISEGLWFSLKLALLLLGWEYLTRRGANERTLGEEQEMTGTVAVFPPLSGENPFLVTFSNVFFSLRALENV